MKNFYKYWPQTFIEADRVNLDFYIRQSAEIIK